jgi:aerobic carbon-monoxide dehydrogenase medium subunit
VIPAAFEYVRATSVDEALAALATPDAKVLAGGQSLLPMMKLRLARPSVLVDIGRLDLRGITRANGTIEIAAMTTYDALLRDSDSLPDALREAVAAVGDLQVRNSGTVAGGIAHGDPASDVAAAFVALGGRARLQSASGTREVPADEFFRGVFTTALEPQELLTVLVVPALEPGSGSAYVSIEDAASGYPLAGAAALVHVAGGQIASCSIGLTGVGAHPRRAPAVEAAVVAQGGAPEPAAIGTALAELPLQADEYRTHLVAVVVRRAIETAVARAREGAKT